MGLKPWKQAKDWIRRAFDGISVLDTIRSLPDLARWLLGAVSIVGAIVVPVLAWFEKLPVWAIPLSGLAFLVLSLVVILLVDEVVQMFKERRSARGDNEASLSGIVITIVGGPCTVIVHGQVFLTFLLTVTNGSSHPAMLNFFWLTRIVGHLQGRVEAADPPGSGALSVDSGSVKWLEIPLNLAPDTAIRGWVRFGVPPVVRGIGWVRKTLNCSLRAQLLRTGETADFWERTLAAKPLGLAQEPLPTTPPEDPPPSTVAEQDPPSSPESSD